MLRRKIITAVCNRLSQLPRGNNASKFPESISKQKGVSITAQPTDTRNIRGDTFAEHAKFSRTTIADTEKSIVRAAIVAISPIINARAIPPPEAIRISQRAFNLFYSRRFWTKVWKENYLPQIGSISQNHNQTVYSYS